MEADTKNNVDRGRGSKRSEEKRDNQFTTKIITISSDAGVFNIYTLDND